MTVYELRHASNIYQSLREASVDDMNVLRQLDGTPVGVSWAPVRVRLFREAKSFEERVPADCPYLRPGVPVFSARAVSVLRDILERHGEVLPLLCDDGDYFAYNVTTLLDALDLEQSDIDFFPDSSRILEVNRYEFIPGRVAGVSIFKLPQLPVSNVYVTAEFVQRVQDHGLTGLRFPAIWPGQ